MRRLPFEIMSSCMVRQTISLWRKRKLAGSDLSGSKLLVSRARPPALLSSRAAEFHRLAKCRASMVIRTVRRGLGFRAKFWGRALGKSPWSRTPEVGLFGIKPGCHFTYSLISSANRYLASFVRRQRECSWLRRVSRAGESRSLQADWRWQVPQIGTAKENGTERKRAENSPLLRHLNLRTRSAIIQIDSCSLPKCL